MSLVRDSVAGIRQQIAAGTLVDRMTEQFVFAHGHRPSPAEQRSWERSLAVLTQDLHDAGLGKVEILLEYRLPLTSRRIDALLCGIHPRTGDSSYVVVELKQWSHATTVDGTEDVVLDDGRGRRLHPAVQVGRYCAYLADFNAGLAGHVDRLAGAAYLHNARDSDLGGLWDHAPTARTRMFTGQRRGEFIEFLRSRLNAVAGASAADELESAAIRPSKQLLTLAAAEIRDREQFVLLDEQQVPYSMVMRAVERSRRANAKEVLIVTGGPGSGKSVIALSLLGELSRQGRSALHATGSSAFTHTLRIRETSVNRYTPAAQRTGRPQVEELIEAARVPVFLLDEHQVVRPGERGNVQDIVDAAHKLGCEVNRIDLNDQFRCGGSRLFEDWVLRLLGLESGGPTAWTGDDAFSLDVAEEPSLMESRLRAYQDAGHNSRMSAGYCWPWSDAKADLLFPDVQIEDWHRPWNNKKESRVGDAPARSFWASEPGGFGQVGCIYTAQGFEYDYSGVIFGPDLVWRDDRWVARPDRSKDTQVRRAAPQDFDRAVRNTYKVLLTRGMRGTLVYSVDPETQRLLRSLVGR